MAKPNRVGQTWRIKYSSRGAYRGSFTGSYADCLKWHAQQVAAEGVEAAHPAPGLPVADPATAPPYAAHSGTCRQLVELYRASIADLASAKTTGHTLNSMIAAAAFIDRPAISITGSDLEDWMKKRLKMAKPGGKLISPSTALFELGAWRRIFRLGARKGWCGLPRTIVNPADDFDVPKRSPDGRAVRMAVRERLLQPGEWERLLAALRGDVPKNYPDLLEDIVTFARLTGQRRSEILKLKVGDVTEHVARLTLTKTGDDQERALVPEVYPWLKAYLTRRTELGQRSLSPDERLFPWGASAGALTMRFNRACKEAGIEGLQFRDLRAEFATDTNDRTGDPLLTIRFTGHRSTRVFQKHYYRKTAQQAAELLRKREAAMAAMMAAK